MPDNNAVLIMPSGGFAGKKKDYLDLSEVKAHTRFHHLMEHVAEQLFHAVHDVCCARKMLAVYEFSQ